MTMQPLVDLLQGVVEQLVALQQRNEPSDCPCSPHGAHSAADASDAGSGRARPLTGAGIGNQGGNPASPLAGDG